MFERGLQRAELRLVRSSENRRRILCTGWIREISAEDGQTCATGRSVCGVVGEGRVHLARLQIQRLLDEIRDFRFRNGCGSGRSVRAGARGAFCWFCWCGVA